MPTPMTKDNTMPRDDEVERLKSERDFLLARANEAGRCYMPSDRWTGVSSNALVEVAFGGKNDALPGDGQDLAACYRTALRLPPHLLSDAVLDQLERGEKLVSETNRRWAQEITGTSASALRPSSTGKRG